MSRRLLWSLGLGIALLLAVLFASKDQDAIANVLSNDTSSLVIKVTMALFVGGLALSMFRDKFSQALEAAMFWLVIGLLLVLGYTYRHDLKAIGDRVLAELIPGRVATMGQTVEIVRGQSGDFSVNTSVNGARIAMVLDTGASSVVLTQDAAKAAGLPIEVLAYTVNVDTANGRTHAAPVTLDRVAIGGLTERGVPALVAQRGQLKNSLLGMSFLNRLESWEVRGDRLRMRGAP